VTGDLGEIRPRGESSIAEPSPCDNLRGEVALVEANIWDGILAGGVRRPVSLSSDGLLVGVCSGDIALGDSGKLIASS
jgi:hypothetical protein